jgi:5-(carboxyamino)imidazole ribonucleotide synthase
MAAPPPPILPGATLGVLGGGQLGKMFAQEARRMGYRVHVLCPELDSPALQVADRTTRCAYDDVHGVEGFARQVSVVTFEFENVPHETAEACARHTLVRPAGAVLHTTQHRLREKEALGRHGLPVSPWRPVGSLEELEAAVRALGGAVVLKTAAWGYDGKGQRVLRAPGDAAAAWASLRPGPLVAEAFVPFEAEVSVVIARGADGAHAVYEPVRNDHVDHILDTSSCPAGLPPAVAARARELAVAAADALGLVGVLCVELFLLPDGALLVNELAPRPHNSGHLSIEACAASQFEQQVRAVCGLPLGDPGLHRPAAMANLLGDLWEGGEPDWAAALRVPGVRLHLYGKAEARPGRKMGHLSALGDSAADARARVLRARAALRRAPGAS